MSYARLATLMPTGLKGQGHVVADAKFHNYTTGLSSRIDCSCGWSIERISQKPDWPMFDEHAELRIAHVRHRAAMGLRIGNGPLSDTPVGLTAIRRGFAL